MMKKIYGIIAFLMVLAFMACVVVVESDPDVSLLGMVFIMAGCALVHVGCVLKTGILTAEYEEKMDRAALKKKSRNRKRTESVPAEASSNMALLQVACMHTVQHR